MVCMELFFFGGGEVMKGNLWRLLMELATSLFWLNFYAEYF